MPVTSTVFNWDSWNFFWEFLGRFKSDDNDKSDNNNYENNSDNNDNKNNKNTVTSKKLILYIETD